MVKGWESYLEIVSYIVDQKKNRTVCVTVSVWDEEEPQRSRDMSGCPYIWHTGAWQSQSGDVTSVCHCFQCCCLCWSRCHCIWCCSEMCSPSSQSGNCLWSMLGALSIGMHSIFVEKKKTKNSACSQKKSNLSRETCEGNRLTVARCGEKVTF